MAEPRWRRWWYRVLLKYLINYKTVPSYNWIGILQSYSKPIKCSQMAIPIPFVAKWPFLFFLWLGGHSFSWLPQYYCIPYQIGYGVGEGLVSKC